MKINWHSHDSVIQRVLSNCQSHCLCSSEWKLDSVLFEFWSLSPTYFESISYTCHHLTPIQTMKTCLALHRQLFESLQLEMDEKKRKVKSVCTLFWFLFMIAPMLVQWGWISHAFWFWSTQYCMSGITRNGLAALDPSWNCSCAAPGSYKLRCVVD